MLVGRNMFRVSPKALAGAIVIACAFAADVSASDLDQGGHILYSGSPYNWSGLYIGGVIGYNWNTDRTSEYYTATGGPRPAFDTPGSQAMFFDYEPEGVSGGVKAGMNFQTGAFVYGVEADFEATDINGGFVDRIEDLGKGVDTYDWQGSVRGRFGLAFNRVLIYGTAGFSFAKIKNLYTLVPLGISEPIKDIRVGWNVGAGLDYALTDRLIAGLEYRYTEFDAFSNVSTVAFPGITGAQEPVSQSMRMSLSYKF